MRNRKRYIFSTRGNVFRDSNGFKIKMNYILGHEGDTSPSISSGYIPMRDNQVVDHSGVTLYGGIDIGQFPKGRKDILRAYGMSSEQADYYLPFLGLKCEEAKRMWYSRGNTEYRLPQEVLERIYAKSISERSKRLFEIFGRGFAAMPMHRQTATFDIFHQFGIHGAPSFTNAINLGIDEGDWSQAGNELADFGAEKYQRRINRNLAMFAGFELPPYVSKGKVIKDMQEELNHSGLVELLKVDGDFGPKTRKALAQYISKS